MWRAILIAAVCAMGVTYLSTRPITEDDRPTGDLEAILEWDWCVSHGGIPHSGCYFKRENSTGDRIARKLCMASGGEPMPDDSCK